MFLVPETPKAGKKRSINTKKKITKNSSKYQLPHQFFFGDRGKEEFAKDQEDDGGTVLLFSVGEQSVWSNFQVPDRRKPKNLFSFSVNRNQEVKRL